MYATEPTSVADLRNRIQIACTDITPETLINVQQGVVHRFQACIACDGGNFEQVLK